MFFKDPNIVNQKYSIYKKILSIQLPSIPSYDKLYSSPEHMFYYDRNRQTIRQFHSGRTYPVNANGLAEYINRVYKINNKFDRVKVFRCLFDYLKEIHNQCIFGPKYNKYLCSAIEVSKSAEFIHFEEPQKNFMNIDGVLCYLFKDAWGNANSAVPITAKNFDNVLLRPYGYPLGMSSDLKKRIIKNLKKLLQSTKSLCDTNLYDMNCNQIIYHKDKLKFIGNPYNLKYWINRLPYAINNDDYEFPQYILDFLQNLFGDNEFAFANFAQLMFAAYCNALPIKKATIITTNPENENAVISFLKYMFREDVAFLNPYDFTDLTFQDSTQFIANINNKKALFIIGNTYIGNFSQLRSIVKSNFQNITDPISGMIKYKNKIPVVLITSNEKYVNTFKNNIASNVIDMKSFPSDIKIQPEDMLRLNQAFVLCGMKYINKQPALRSISRLKAMSNKDIVSKFVNDYCRNEPQSVTSKLELRNAFKQFTEALYPHYRGNSSAVCNLLRDMDYDGTHKTRLENGKNPVAVFRGVFFNKHKFETEIKNYILPTLPPASNEHLCGFEKILNELKTATL